MPLPTDSLLSQQWHLGNTGGRFDLNVRSIWNPAAGTAYTGAGVRVVVIDSGFDYGHPDLAPNYDTTLDRAFVNNDADASPGGDHGTSAMGIIGAAANNGGVVGVAFDAKLIGFRNNPSADDARLTTTRDALRAAVSSPVNGDVINISQGLSNDINTDFGANRTFSLFAELDAAIGFVVVYGRGGSGTTIVKSAGNARHDNYDVNADGMANDTRQVVVAAVDQNGYVSDYSSFGSAILVSAFGSNRDVVTTDRRGTDGYNTAASPGGDYNMGFDGTSAAAPMVTGIVALMLQASPWLGWRDVQTILAYSARHVGSPIGATAPGGDERFLWQFNGATNWNGDGLHYSNDYGYGLVDAHAAVRLAETWANGPQTSLSQRSIALDVLNATSVLPDGNSTGITYQGSNTTLFEVERATVTVKFSSVGRLSDLQLYLISPSGTVSQLIKNDDAPYGSNNSWTFESQAFRGETSVGQWSVRAVDSVTGFSTTFTDVVIEVFGRGNANDDTYVYTDDYAEMVALHQGHGWEWQDDDGGLDFVSFAALSSSTSINYDTGVTTIDGLQEFGGFGSSDPALYVIERFTFGDGNDFLVANFANNEIRGMRGNDELHGRDGSDTIFGGTGNDLLYGDNQADRLEGEDGDDVLDGGADGDDASGGTGNDMLFGESLSTAGLTFGSGLYTRPLNQNNTSFANAANVSNLWSLALDVNILGSTAAPHVKIRALTDDTTPATQFYKVNVKAGDVLLLDMDVTGEDLAMRVFDAAGHVVAQSDDSNTAIGSGGSTTGTNPYIAYLAETSGSYTIEIGNRVSGRPLNSDLVLGPLARAASFELNISLVSTIASDGVDTLIGNAGNDIIIGGNDVDVMWGGADADILIGGAGDDMFVFDTGDVTNGEDIQGGAGTDEFYIRSTTSFVSDSTFLAFPTSIETITLVNAAQATFYANHFGPGRIASDVLLKDDGVGANTLAIQMDAATTFDASRFRFDASWDAADVVQITGDSSSETITGSSRGDRIIGGGGNDLFVFVPGGGADTITDFVAGAGADDRIDLSAFHATLGYVLGHATQVGNNTVFNFGGGDTLTLQNVLKTSLKMDDFAGLETTPHDFNGDGMSDILLRNDAGIVAIWAMNDTTIIHGSSLNSLPTNWSIADTGDFNGDGKSGDLLLRNNAGAVAIWDMNDGVNIGGGAVATLSANWHIAGTGDFNGDHKSDIVLRNDAGGLAIWDMNDTAILHGNSLGNVPTNWTVAGTGDFNGDGKSDLLWRNDAGVVAIWDMNDGAVIGGGTVGTVPANWHIAGTGDFNGDNKSDILWRNDAGLVAIWDMNDTVNIGGGSVATLAANWHVESTGDYNVDGKSDILLRNDAGGIAIWDMNDTAIIGGGSVGSVAANWHIIV